MEKEWKSAIGLLSKEDREQAFQLRVDRCTPEIRDTFETLKDRVYSFGPVSISIDNKVDGMTFFRTDISGRRRFFQDGPEALRQESEHWRRVL